MTVAAASRILYSLYRFPETAQGRHQTRHQTRRQARFQARRRLLDGRGLANAPGGWALAIAAGGPVAQLQP